MNEQELCLRIFFSTLLLHLLFFVFLPFPIKTTVSKRLFVAHHVVSVFTCAFAAVFGFIHLDMDAMLCRNCALQHDAHGEFLAYFFIAVLSWDMLIMPFSKELSSHVMLFHHLTMLAGICVSLAPLLQKYVTFYVGVCEISSVPLQFIELVHPARTILPTHVREMSFTRHVIFGMKLTFFVLFMTFRVILAPLHFFSILLVQLMEICAYTSTKIMLSSMLMLIALQVVWGCKISYKIVKKCGIRT